MRFEDEIYFSKNHQWGSINIDDGNDLLNKFKDRVQTLYLEQVTILNKADSYYNSFAVGVLLFSVIDCLGGYLTTHNGFENHLQMFLKESEEFNSEKKDAQRSISKKIRNSFRNGLVHNGRVKDSCQFDYDFDDKLFVLQDEILIINNKYLEELVINVFEKFIQSVKTNNKEMSKFVNRFKNDFADELKRLL